MAKPKKIKRDTDALPGKLVAKIVAAEDGSYDCGVWHGKDISGDKPWHPYREVFEVVEAADQALKDSVWSIYAALRVLTDCPAIEQAIRSVDPKAYEQAQAALDALDEDEDEA